MEAWNNFLALNERLLGQDTVSKWLLPLKVQRFDACNLYLEAKDSFQILWFEEHVRKKCEESLLNNNGTKIKVHLQLPGKEPLKKKGEKKSPPPLFKISFNDPDPNLTFETFVPSEGNILAYKLLTKLVHDQSDLISFNPIYLHGLTGAGKTHLLAAVCNGMKQKDLNAAYIRADTFTDHVVNAIRNGQMSQFRQSYRNLNALIIDDVHLFEKKWATQEELFHTFNTLHLNGKQIILSANGPPSELQGVEARLISRFEWGIVLPLECANGELMHSILEKKSETLKAPLTKDTAQFLCKTFSSDTTRLVRALEALTLRTQGNKHPWTPSFAAHHLKDLICEEQKFAITQDDLMTTIAEHFGIPQEEILGKGQTRECTLPRQMAMGMFRKILNMPYTKIGDVFQRDHSTVMTSCKGIEKKLHEEDPIVAPSWREILKKVKTAG
jgi:chromosomal replication initiator protein